MSGYTTSHGVPSIAAPKGTLSLDVDTPDLYQNIDGATTWSKLLRTGTAVSVTGLTLTGFAVGVLHSVAGVVSSSQVVAADIANNTITGAQLARGGTNQVFFSASSGVDPSFTASPTLATSLTIGTSSAAPASDALVLARHANTDRVSLVWAGETGAGTWRMGMPTGASSDIAVRLWYTANGNTFSETNDTRFYFSTISNQFVVASDGVVSPSLAIASNFNSTGEARVQMLAPQSGVGRILRIMGHGSTGSTGGDVAIDSGDGASSAWGSIRLRSGTTSPIDRVTVKGTGVVQFNAYTTSGVAHFDTFGNITSSLVSLTADVTGTLPVGNLPVSGGGTSIVGTGRTVTGTAPIAVNGGNTAVTLANDITVSIANATTGAVGAVQLAGDLAGTATSVQVAKVKGTSITTAGGALTTGQSLRVTGTATADWGAIDLANANAVTGTLPVGNLPVSGGGSSVVGTGRTLTGSGAIKIAGDNSPHDLSADRTISVASATALALGVVQLTTDLAGTATAPIVVQLTGNSGTVNVLASTFLFDRSVSPFFGQTQAASGPGALFQLQAQQGGNGNVGGIFEIGGGNGGVPGTDLAGDTYVQLGQAVSNATAALRIRRQTTDVLSIAQTASGVTTIDSSGNIIRTGKLLDAAAGLLLDETSAPSAPSAGATLFGLVGTGGLNSEVRAIHKSGAIYDIVPGTSTNFSTPYMVLRWTTTLTQTIAGGSTATSFPLGQIDVTSIAGAPSSFFFTIKAFLKVSNQTSGSFEDSGFVEMCNSGKMSSGAALLSIFGGDGTTYEHDGWTGRLTGFFNLPFFHVTGGNLLGITVSSPGTGTTAIDYRFAVTFELTIW